MTLDINKTDLYALLSVGEEATQKELVKAYRKTALKCHPDKNPDNPEAANEFQRLSRAFEILSDGAARAAYDKTRKAKKASEARHKVLDSKRKKFKEDLEARERTAQDQRGEDIRAERNLEAEIERLRKQGSSLLEQEQEFLKEQLKKEVVIEVPEEVPQTQPSKWSDTETCQEEAVSPKLKVSWNAKSGDESNGGYSYRMMHNMFSKYGEVTALILSGKKTGRGIVEYKSPRSAAIAFKNETGLKSNPFTLKWLSGKPNESSGDSVPLHAHEEVFNPAFNPWSSGNGLSSFTTEFNPNSVPPTSQRQHDFEINPTMPSYEPIESQDRDFESLVLMKMRQAEERKRIIEQMQKEDEES